MMSSLDLVKPWRLLVSALPVLYGALLLLGLPNSFNWFLLAIGIILFAVMIVSRLDLPLLALWPAFAGLFLLCACVFALIENVVDYAIVPFTDTDSELVLMMLIASGFIIWSLSTFRKMTDF